MTTFSHVVVTFPRSRSTSGTVAEQAQTRVVLLVVLLLTYILLLFSDAILRIIGRQGAAILVRVMGIILASLAVEIVLTALGVASWAPVSR